jgi:hypothetical protein
LLVEISNAITYTTTITTTTTTTITVSGLSDYSRDAVEGGYKSGLISVLVCTSTLAAGVNLPAGRVVINGLKIGYSDVLGVIQYRQMCGRAGRAGLTTGDAAAESFLLVRPAERGAALALAAAPFPAVTSQMCPGTRGGVKGFLRAVLELCSLGLCDSPATFSLYLQQTLFYRADRQTSDAGASTSGGDGSSGGGGITGGSGSGGDTGGSSTSSSSGAQGVPDQALQALQFLLNAQILVASSSSGPSPQEAAAGAAGAAAAAATGLSFELSRLGRAIIACNMNPDEAIVYYGDLLRARDNLNLETHLHVAYLCAPLYHALTPDFGKLFRALTSLDRHSPMHRVMRAVGLEEGVLARWVHAPPSAALIRDAADILRQMKSNTGALLNNSNSTNNSTSNNSTSTNTNSTSTNSSSSSSSREAEVSMICRCKRLWAAQVLVEILDAQDTARVRSCGGCCCCCCCYMHISTIAIG